MFSVLYVDDGYIRHIRKMGPYPTEDAADAAAVNGQKTKLYDVHDQNVYLLYPDHGLRPYTIDELCGTRRSEKYDGG